MNKTENNHYPINIFIRIVVLSIILVWSFLIAKPFVLLIVWAAIIAIALYPTYEKLLKLFNGKQQKTITLLFTIILSGIIIIPVLNIAESIIGSTTDIVRELNNGDIKFEIPESESRNIELIKDRINNRWENATNNIDVFIQKHSDKLINSISWFFKAFKNLMLSVILSIIAVIISGVFLHSAKDGYSGSVKFAEKLAPGRGHEIIDMCIVTIRSVVKGILLVAVIQGFLAYIGFEIVGLKSSAGILSFLIMFFAIIQIPILIVMLPIIIYVFTTTDTTGAVIFAIYMVIVSLIDNILKPIFFSKGLQTPMIIILIGAIGGMMFQGIIGLFVGPVILAVTHKIYTIWVNKKAEIN